jgi:hypothetical protein
VQPTHRFPALLSLPLLLLPIAGCDRAGSPDAIDAVGVPDGKLDDTTFTTCQLAAVVDHLNGDVTADALEAAGVHPDAAEALAAHRLGADGEPWTGDDGWFDDIAAVDAVDYVGPEAMAQLVAIIADSCLAWEAYAPAHDVTLAVVDLGAVEPPTDYDYPSGDGFDLGGTEFWQRWPGGHSPTFDFSAGTDAGRRCMQAAAYRFEAIMASPPASLVQLREESNWDGSFFNWNDDYTMATSDGAGARLWAWQTYLVKWISQTRRDGTCALPTLAMVEVLAANCLATSQTASGEIQGCRAP